jgi:hypothetical protein
MNGSVLDEEAAPFQSRDAIAKVIPGLKLRKEPAVTALFDIAA